MKRLAWILFVLALALLTACGRKTYVADPLTPEEERKKIEEQDRRVKEGEASGGGSYNYGVKDLDRRVEEAERNNSGGSVPKEP